MMELDFAFEESPLEVLLAQIPAGGSISAAQFLALTEADTEETVQEMLMALEMRRISLDISDFPAMPAAGEASVRLRREAQLAADGLLPGGLEENDPLRLCLEEIASNCEEADPEKMAAAYARGQDTVMERLTKRMLPVVAEMAVGFVGRGVLLLDLIQEGSMGLWQAILSYRSGEFVPYAKWYIGQYLARALVMRSREMGFGQRLKEAMEDFRSVDERLLSELGRNPTLEEIAEAMHITPEEAANVGKMLESARLLSRAKMEQEEPEEDPEDAQHVEDTALFQSRQRIENMLSGLDKQEAELIALRFGLEGGMPLSAEDTGKRLGLTPEEVVALETAALRKMRNHDSN